MIRKIIQDHKLRDTNKITNEFLKKICVPHKSYLNEITKSQKISESRLQDIHDDEKEILSELETLKNFISNA